MKLIFSQEAEIVNKLSETVLNKEVTLRPELERWMMRNEELEQRLFEYAQRMRVLEIVISIDSNCFIQF